MRFFFFFFLVKSKDSGGYNSAHTEGTYCTYISLYLRISEMLYLAYMNAAACREARINSQAFSKLVIYLLLLCLL